MDRGGWRATVHRVAKRDDLAQQEQQIKTLEERITSLLLHFFFFNSKQVTKPFYMQGL